MNQARRNIDEGVGTAVKSSPQSILESIKHRVLERWPLEKWSRVKTLVAVSGGADSVAMLRVLVDCCPNPGGHLIVGHVNHQTRGEQSDDDEQFVRELTEQLRIPFLRTRLDLPHSATEQQLAGEPVTRLNIDEATLRAARYNALEKMARQSGTRYIATGHHRDDQIETVLFRLFRGTGPAGIGGIPGHRPACEGLTIIRPLLPVSRAEIKELLVELALTHRTDVSNDDSAYTRNFIRNELLPIIRERFGDSVDGSIERLVMQTVEQSRFIETSAAQFDDAVVVSARNDGSRIEIDSDTLRSVAPVLIRCLLVRSWRRAGWPEGAMRFAHWQTLCELVTNGTPGPAINLPGNIRAERTGSLLVLTPQ